MNKMPKSKDEYIKSLESKYKDITYAILELSVKRKVLKKHLDMQTKKWVYEKNPLCTDAELKRVLEVLVSANIAYNVAVTLVESGILDVIPDLPSRVRMFIDKTQKKLDRVD
jgi:hypothetical protein